MIYGKVASVATKIAKITGKVKNTYKYPLLSAASARNNHELLQRSLTRSTNTLAKFITNVTTAHDKAHHLFRWKSKVTLDNLRPHINSHSKETVHKWS